MRVSLKRGPDLGQISGLQAQIESRGTFTGSKCRAGRLIIA